jgi:BolA family transcriptional regulator, general stress-responsive regulator
MLEEIQRKIEKALDPNFIQLRDDSGKHAGHVGWREGKLTHLHIVVASKKFEGLSKVKRHQYIYKILAEEIEAGLHAVSMKVYSSEEIKDLKSQ